MKYYASKPVEIDGFKKALIRTYVRKEIVMNKNELLEYIETNSAVITIFKDKVRTAQKVKNKKRQPAKRWNEAKIERTVDKITDEFINNVYDKLAKGVKANRRTTKQQWITFIEEHEILDELEESVIMISFE